MNSNEKRGSSLQVLLYDYLENSKLRFLIAFIIFSYLVQLIGSLVDFDLVKFIANVLPILISIGLLRFYSSVMKREFTKDTLNLIVSLLKFAFVVAIISAVLTGFVFFASLASGHLWATSYLLTTTLMVVFLALAYKASADALSGLGKSFFDARINREAFDAAGTRWLLYGAVSLFALLLLFTAPKDVSDLLESSINFKRIDLTDLSTVLTLLQSIFGAITPFVLSYAFKKGDQNLARIQDEYYASEGKNMFEDNASF